MTGGRSGGIILTFCDASSETVDLLSVILILQPLPVELRSIAQVVGASEALESFCARLHHLKQQCTHPEISIESGCVSVLYLPTSLPFSVAAKCYHAKRP
jgi:hypothetical protein